MFEDHEDQMHTCQKCGGEFPESEMANDQVCKHCDAEHGQNASFFNEADEHKLMGDEDFMTLSDDDDDFAGADYADDEPTTDLTGSEEFVTLEQVHPHFGEVDDDDFAGMEDDDDDDDWYDTDTDWCEVHGAPENCLNDDEPCYNKTGVVESTNFDKFMDSTVIRENRKARRVVIEDNAAVRYNKRYGEKALNRIKIKQ